MSATVSPQVVAGHVTVEKTSKHLKAHKVLAQLSAVGGFAGIMAAPPNGTASFIASLAMLVGIVWVIVTKVRIWWNHG